MTGKHFWSDNLCPKAQGADDFNVSTCRLPHAFKARVFGRLRFVTFRSVILLLAGLLACGASHASKPVKPWFTPWLQTDDDPVCASVLQNATERFMSPLRAPFSFHDYEGNASTRSAVLGELTRVPQGGSRGYQPDPTFEYLEDQRQHRLVQPDGAQFYVARRWLGGCGGYCDREEMMVSDESLAGDRTAERPHVTTPKAHAWDFFRSADGTYFLVAFTDDHIQIFRIVAPKRWKLSCDIATVPDLARAPSDPDFQSILRSIDSFESAVNGMNGGGYCGMGTEGTGSRWHRYRREGYEQALYRPWGMQPWDPPLSDEIKGENSGGDYSRIREQLKTWSLGGLYEQQAYARYIEQLDDTGTALAHFYTKKFGWALEQARRIAEGALTTAVSEGMGFYLYAPFANAQERALRGAILNRQPMQDIRKMEIDADVAGRLLDIAVRYPQALRYLLERGARVDWTNGFGKTALMYAAQYDQIESAQVLLDGGADPNAATFLPTDTCDYSLQTAGMTPLHYAVRYASAKLIDLLLARGAVSFRRATNGVPMDWLRKYGDPETPEFNAKLTNDERLRIAARLQPPDEAALEKIAHDLIRKSRREYQTKRLEQAYRSADLALHASPKNREALALFQLVALRAGHKGASLEAGELLLKLVTDPRELANIRFNLGLACENERYLSHHDRDYCTGDPVSNFLEAWKLAPTSARRNKLDELLTAPRPGTCVVGASNADVRHYRFEFMRDDFGGKFRQVQRIYVRHASDQSPDTEAISWTIKRRDGGKIVQTRIVPTRMERLALGRFAVSIYESEFRAEAPVQVEAQPCDLK